jgi:hypothetical protein
VAPPPQHIHYEFKHYSHASDWENAGNGLTSLDADGNIQIHQVGPDSQDTVRRMTQWIPFYDTLMTHSALASVARGLTVKMLHRDALTPHQGKSGEEVFDEKEPHNLGLLRELHRQVRDAGGRLLLLFLPKYQALHPESDPDKVSHLFQRRLTQWTLDLGIPLIDIGPIYKNALDRIGTNDPAHLFFLKDGHANARGYQLIASTIADYLARRPDLIARKSQEGENPASR